MRIYKKGGKSGNNPPKPGPPPARMNRMDPSMVPNQALDRSLQGDDTMSRLQQMIGAMQRSEAAPPRDFGPIARREDVIQYLADKYNMPVEDVAADMPDPVRTYVMPRAGGGGSLDQGAVGMYNQRQFSGEKRRNNPFEKRNILVAGNEADNPFTRNEELIHSMQPRNATGSFVDQYTYADLVDPVLKRLSEVEGIDMRDPAVAADIAYSFDPQEMEAKIMTQKMILRNAGVIGEGELTEEDLDNMYLYANDMYRSPEGRSREGSYHLIRLLGRPTDKRSQDPEYRAALLNLFNKL